MSLHVIILAGGQGRRMVSGLPKVLHPVAGRPMLARSLKAVMGLKAGQVRVVAGKGSNIVSSIAGKFKALCFKQSESAYGTAHAALSARPEELKGEILIINGDHPLIETNDLLEFVRKARTIKADCAVASFKIKRKITGQIGFGRLIFDGDQLKDIVEAYETDKKAKESDFVNAGLYFVKAEFLSESLKAVKKNIREEYNLTDIIAILHKRGRHVRAVEVSQWTAFGVNNQADLAIATAIAFERACLRCMTRGVVVIDPKTAYIEDDVFVGKGSLIYPNVYLRGQSKIGAFCALESNVHIFDSLIRNYVNIRAGSYIEGSIINEKAIIGPYARLRPGSMIGAQCRIGNFVETKEINMGQGSKAGHLSYLGDAEIGENVNIGCGTVTCNYTPDRAKHKTIIGDGVFVGSGSQLVAPVRLGEKAVIGAGSVITKNVPKGSLALSRAEQKHKTNYTEQKRKANYTEQKRKANYTEQKRKAKKTAPSSPASDDTQPD